jgi:hypothetical protein
VGGQHDAPAVLGPHGAVRRQRGVPVDARPLGGARGGLATDVLREHPAVLDRHHGALRTGARRARYDPLRLRSYVATLDLAAGAIEAEPRETG